MRNSPISPNLAAYSSIRRPGIRLGFIVRFKYLYPKDTNSCEQLGLGMPKKVALKKGKKNNQLWTTLPAGARFQLDQLVALKVEGDSHSEVIRALIIAHLKTMRKEYGLRAATPAELAALKGEDGPG